MELLVRARPLILTLFFMSLAVIGIGAAVNTRVVFHTGGGTAQIALFLFILTESFGSIAQKRTRTSRNIARVFLVLSGLTVTGIIINLLMVLFT